MQVIYFANSKAVLALSCVFQDLAAFSRLQLEISDFVIPPRFISLFVRNIELVVVWVVSDRICRIVVMLLVIMMFKN